MNLTLSLDKNKCWICDYRKTEDFEKRHYLPYLCTWCYSQNVDFGGSRLKVTELIENVTDDARKYFEEGRSLDCENVDVLSFCADVGELSAHHPYLKQFGDMIGMIAIQIALENRYIPSELIKIAQGINIQEKWIRIYQCLLFLVDVNLLELGQGRFMYEIYRPSHILSDLSSVIETVSRVENQIPPRIANCIIGYALLKGIKISIEWLREKRDFSEELKGVLRLYPMTKSGALLVPKKFTAPTMFLLGYLAYGHDEFSEGDLRAWLNMRGISGSNANEIINWVCRATRASTHRLVNPKYDGSLYHFKINENYIRMRERFRERQRQRGRVT